MFLRPFNFVSAICWPLVLVLAGLCGWSYHRTDVAGYVSSVSSNRTCNEFCLVSSRGQLSLLAVVDSPPVLVGEAGKFGWQVSDPVQAKANFGMMGFSANREWTSATRNGVVSLGVPYWFLILFAAMLPAWWAHRQRKRKKAAKQ
jgi:hypothetical protein